MSAGKVGPASKIPPGRGKADYAEPARANRKVAPFRKKFLPMRWRQLSSLGNILLLIKPLLPFTLAAARLFTGRLKARKVAVRREPSPPRCVTTGILSLLLFPLPQWQTNN